MDLNEQFEIKSESIGDLFIKMNEDSLIYDPYYQRNFVWTTEHQKEFIRTILLGLPCPMIFVAEGKIDLETHVRHVHIIDGQQRMRTIQKYLFNELEVDNKYYKDLDDANKMKFSIYKIGTVRLKYNPEEDIDKIKEIFHRLNIGKFELTETEKTISKFSDNEFVYFARLISNDKILETNQDPEEQTSVSQQFRENPFISDEFKSWCMKKSFKEFSDFFLNQEIYSIQEMKRNTNTKDVLDMIAIIIDSKFHGRTLSDERISELTTDVLLRKDNIYAKFKNALSFFNKIEIPEIDGFKKRKYLYQRSNAFSLFTSLLLNSDSLNSVDIEKYNDEIKKFNNALPDEYVDVAKNSPMEKKQREIRNKYFQSILEKSI